MHTYLDGPAAGEPAVLRHEFGDGTAWYVSTRLHDDDLATALHPACTDAAITPRDDLPADLEVVRRGPFLFALNHGPTNTTLPTTGTELLTGTPCDGLLDIPAGEVRVVHLG